MSPGPLALRILVVFLTVLLGAAVADRVMKVAPAQYLSTVTMQVRNPDSKVAVRPFEKTRQLILRREVLEPVTKSLGLTGADPVAQLRRALNIREVRNTELVQISVTADSAAEAARRANAVAEEFQRREIEAQQKQLDHRLEPLRAEVAAQREKVEKLRTAADQIRRGADITDFNPGTVEEFKTLREAIEALKIEVANLTIKAEKLAALSDEQVLEEISNATEFGKSLDPTLTNLSAELQNVAAEEAKISRPDDPRLEVLQSKRALLDKQRSALVPVLRGQVKAGKESEEAKLKAVEQLMSSATAAQPKGETVEKYHAAKQEYLQHRKVLEAAEMKLSTEKMDSSLPQNPVIIWERAEPPSHPDSRPRVLLTISILLGLLVGCGLAFLPRPGLVAGGVAVLLAVTLVPRLLADDGAVPAKPFTPRISVGGDVKAPQLLDYAEDLTILRVINAAGGFTEYADQKKVRLLRAGKVMVVDVTAIRLDPAKDVPLKSGDSIEVPQSFW